MHWDHADGMDLFPNARIWIQKDELEYYAGNAWQSRIPTAASTRRRIDAGEAEHPGPRRPGEWRRPGNPPRHHLLHRRQPHLRLEYVGVSTGAGTVILASDNMYLYENLEKHVPIAATLDAASNLRAQDRMKQLAASPA